MKQYRIEEICEVISGGTPSTKVAGYWNGDIIWLTPKDLSNTTTKWISRSSNKITKDGLDNSAARMLPINTVLLSSRAPIGYLALAGKQLCTNQGFKSMICNTNYILPEYLYYYLHTKVEELNSISTGSTFKELSSSLLKNYVVSIHDLTTQQHIVDILGTLDEKIENNERIIDYFESTMEILFLQMLNNQAGEWSKKSLTDIAEYTNGLAMQKHRPVGDFSLPVVKIRELSQGAIDSNSEMADPSIDKKFIIDDGDVIFAWSGTLLVKIWCGGKAGLNQHLFKVTSTQYPLWFIYLWTKQHLKKFQNIAQGKAVTMGHIKREDLEKSTVLIPSIEILNKYDDLIAPFYHKIVKIRQENRLLSNLKSLYLKQFFR